MLIHLHMRVIETSLEEDLSLFSSYLWQQKVPHRVYEERGRQIVEVAEDASGEPVRAAYAAWRSGQLVLERAAGSAAPQSNAWWRWLLLCPVTVLVVAGAIIVFPFSVQLEDRIVTPLVGLLTIVELRPGASAHWRDVLASGLVWRWFTPVFLHFSFVHLAFNCAITFELGRRIEAVAGPWRFAALVVFIGVISNFGQIVWNPYPIFGGLSGVAYGLLGYLLVMQRRFAEDPHWQLPPGITFSLLLFLVVFSTGITESFGLRVANAAHWSGISAGALTALVVAGLGGPRASARG